jgi:hypothetical protein
MAIGGYQMPRIGNPDQFQPQQAMTPPNAQPAQGQLPQAAHGAASAGAGVWRQGEGLSPQDCALWATPGPYQ